jgi:hypothetical protein
MLQKVSWARARKAGSKSQAEGIAHFWSEAEKAQAREVLHRPSVEEPRETDLDSHGGSAFSLSSLWSVMTCLGIKTVRLTSETLRSGPYRI